MRLKLTILSAIWLSIVVGVFGWFGTAIVGNSIFAIAYWTIGWLIPIAIFSVPFLIYLFQED